MGMGLYSLIPLNSAGIDEKKLVVSEHLLLQDLHGASLRKEC